MIQSSLIWLILVHILQWRGLFVDQTTVMLMTPTMGTTLMEERLHRGQVAFVHKIRMLVELLRGVVKFEQAGWVHGSIEPSNVLLFGGRICTAPEPSSIGSPENLRTWRGHRLCTNFPGLGKCALQIFGAWSEHDSY